jgi:RimJ/RimL family protein N-acetyltransferase
MTFVPDDFDVPPGIVTDAFLLEPLGPQHNDDDYDAWSTSMEHIQATPGWGEGSWPRPMTLEENLRDLQMHAGHFAERRGFTYTVLDPQTRRVIGCLYIYPAKDDVHDARVRSWVRATHAELDVPLRRAVAGWLVERWPFHDVEYAS